MYQDHKHSKHTCYTPLIAVYYLKFTQLLTRQNTFIKVRWRLKELRSDIWIVKKMRGVYGNTTTSKKMNHMIDDKIKSLAKEDKEEASASRELRE